MDNVTTSIQEEALTGDYLTQYRTLQNECRNGPRGEAWFGHMRMAELQLDAAGLDWLTRQGYIRWRRNGNSHTVTMTEKAVV